MIEKQKAKINDLSIISAYLLIIRENPFFFIPYTVFLITGIFELVLLQKGESLLWINRYNTPYLDKFFYFFTDVGNGLLYAAILVPLAVLKIRYSFIGLVSFVSSGLGSQIFKRLFDLPRPKAFFGDAVLLHFVAGYNVYTDYSFPSGHSTTAFSMFMLLSILTPMKPLGLVYFIFAMLVGISRIYLVQHFFIDVYFGSIIGVFFTMTVYILVSRYLKQGSRWADYSIFTDRFKDSFKRK